MNEALNEAVRKTHEDMNELENQGFQNHEAWEMVRERYLFLPEEEGLTDDEEANEAARFYTEFVREMNKILQEEDES